MENHPIPQDITGFQFKLIGNMTIKQFVYLAVGAIFAWLFFFMLGLPTLIRLPLSIISFSVGAIIAFVPIDGRPMDTMLANFFRALISPTEFIYQKEGVKLPDQPSPAPKTGLKAANQASNNLSQSVLQSGSQINQSFSQPLSTPAQTSQPGLSQHEQTSPHHSFFHDLKESMEHKSHTPKSSQDKKETHEDSKEIKEIKKENKQLQKEIDEIKKSIEKPHLSVAYPPAQAQTLPQQASMASFPSVQPPPLPPAPANPTRAPFMITEESSDSAELEKKNKEIKKVEEEKDRLKQEVELLKARLEEAIKTKEEAVVRPPPPPPPPPVPQQVPAQQELEKQLIESNRQKEALEKELVNIKSRAQEQTKTFNPIIAKPLESTQRVRSVPPGMEKSVGIPSVPDAPNLITGIVKDSRGNPLQNILIEVKDQDSNPVRAFKTNGLGKFASATSLSNGKYVISFEDPAETHKFDSVELELVGAPVMPLEIISVDPREELRRELFN